MNSFGLKKAARNFACGYRSLTSRYFFHDGRWLLNTMESITTTRFLCTHEIFFSHLCSRFEDLHLVQQRDQQKRALCDKYGITLIVVPFWWDNTTESVAQTIHLARPDIPLRRSLLRGDAIPLKGPAAKEIKPAFFPKEIEPGPLFDASGW